MGDPLVHRRNSMFYGAMLLTAGSVAIRFVQMLFQVYISGVMGAEGLGQMQLVMTVGGFASIVASGGVRIAATCLAAEEAGMGRPSGIRAAVRCCGLYGLGLSVLVGAGLFFLAEPLAQGWMERPGAALPLKILAVSMPIGCLWSVMAGYFIAAGRITELVGVELAERLGSVGLVAALLRAALLDPCTCVFLGSAAASGVSFLFLLARYGAYARKSPAAPLGPMMRRLIHLTVPIGLNDILRSGLNLLENMLIPRGLKKGGASGQDALAAYGTVCGMVFPVITFPSVILYSLSDLLVPEMARSRAKGRDARIRFLSDKCLHLALLFAVAAAGLCLALGDELGRLLFGSMTAGVYIRVYAPLIPILYLDAITDGILKGLSQQLHSVRYNTLTSILDVTMIFFLLPRYGMDGFLAAFTVSHALNFYLSLRRLIVVTGYRPRFSAAILAALCCGGGLMVLALLPRVGSAVGTLLRGGLFLGVYGLLLRLCGALGGEDLRWLQGLIRRKNARNG